MPRHQPAQLPFSQEVFRACAPHVRQPACPARGTVGIRSTDDMLRRFKRDLGYFSSFTTPDGVTEIEYRSISFAAMEQHEFERFYDDCVNLVLTRYIRGLDKKDIEEEIERFM